MRALPHGPVLRGPHRHGWHLASVRVAADPGAIVLAIAGGDRPASQLAQLARWNRAMFGRVDRMLRAGSRR